MADLYILPCCPDALEIERSPKSAMSRTRSISAGCGRRSALRVTHLPLLNVGSTSESNTQDQTAKVWRGYVPARVAPHVGQNQTLLPWRRRKPSRCRLSTLMARLSQVTSELTVQRRRRSAPAICRAWHASTR